VPSLTSPSDLIDQAQATLLGAGPPAEPTHAEAASWATAWSALATAQLLQGALQAVPTVAVDVVESVSVLIGDLRADLENAMQAVYDGAAHRPAEDNPEDGRDLLEKMGTNGKAWAEEFLKLFTVDRRGPDDVEPMGLMVGWFANAIEAGRAAGSTITLEPLQSTKAELEALRGIVRKLKGGGKLRAAMGPEGGTLYHAGQGTSVASGLTREEMDAWGAL
jgi:hypothetical protein